jgi:mono/diheme cytochrome c family protein
MNARTMMLLGGALLLSSALSATADTAVKNLYQLRCTKCHGADGTGQGKIADLLDPKPANFTSAKWQASRTDAQIVDSITNGHESKQKLSKKMPYFGTRYSAVEIEALVTVVRGFKKP